MKICALRGEVFKTALAENLNIFINILAPDFLLTSLPSLHFFEAHYLQDAINIIVKYSFSVFGENNMTRPRSVSSIIFNKNVKINNILNLSLIFKISKGIC